MSNVNKYTTASIDFDAIKSDLKKFLQFQDEFSDYDFEGSGLNVLLNILAYNTHYNTVYDNFAINEAFLDTAFKRSSVISHAGLLNYIPRSYVGSVAKLNIVVTNDSVDAPEILTLPAYTAFSTSVGEKSYSFYTKSDYSVARNGSAYVFENIPIYEGRFVEQEGTYTGDYYQCFTLSSGRIDSSSIVVTVDEQTETNVFDRAEDILKIDGNSKVYFLKMNPDETFQIQFGNGTIGQALKAGDIVRVSYLVCNGSEVNGARNFVFGDSFGTGLTAQITCVQSAIGGAEPESTDDIRMNAPRMYSTQNRLVTENDYQYAIQAGFSNARAVKAWGGQKMNPPQYGKVFVSVITRDGDALSGAEKTRILNEIIEPRRVLCTIPEFVDPEYIHVQVVSNVYYDSQRTTLSGSDIETLVKNSILNYSDDNLGNFGSVMRFSKLSAAIDASENSVTNNSTKIRLFIEKEPQYGVSYRYQFEIDNPVYRPLTASESVLSEGFYCSDVPNVLCYIDDNPVTGKLRIFYKNNLGEKIVSKDVGTIDYDNGVLDITSLNVTSVTNDKLRFMIVPASNDVASEMNRFAMIDPSLMKVTAIANSDEYVHSSSK